MIHSFIYIMPRTRAPGRLRQIIDAATDAFIASGYRLARIEDIAHRAGVAPATVHLYARTKDALFDLVIRAALHDPTVDQVELPYSAPSQAELIERVWQRLNAAADFPLLDTAPADPPPHGAMAELAGIIRELYHWVLRHHRAIKLIERCAREWPELAALFYRQFRRAGLDRLSAYLERRAHQGALRATPDPAIAARVVLETISFFAMHRFSAPDSQMDDARTEAVVLEMLTNALRPSPR
jgi:AcrR family transcriptional regulator